MAVVGRIKDNKFLINDCVDERVPVIQNGLIAHFPFDGRGGTFDSISGYQPSGGVSSGVNFADVLGWRDPHNWGAIDTQTNVSDVTWDEGLQALRFTGNIYRTLKVPIVIDYNKTYTVSCEILQEDAGSTPDNQLLYLGGHRESASFKKTTTNYDYSIKSGWKVTPLNEWIKVTKTYSPGLVRYTGGWYSQSATNPSGDDYTRYWWFGGLWNYNTTGSAKVLLRNLVITTTDIDTSNTTISNDGIAIEDATTNLMKHVDLPNNWYVSQDAAYGYVSHSTMYFPEFDLYGLRKTVTGSDYRGTLNQINWNTPTDMNVPYTFSIYARCVKNIAGANINLNYQGADAVGTRKDITVSHRFTDDKWKRISITSTPSESGFSTILSAMKIYTQSLNGEETTIDIVAPQLEQRNYYTSFVNGSRGKGSLEIPVDVGNGNFTIFGEFIPDTPFKNSSGGYDKGTANQATLICLTDTVNAGNIYYRYWMSGDTSSAPFLDPDGVYGTSHIHQNYEIEVNVPMYYAIRRNNTSISLKIFQNGLWKSEHVLSINDIPRLDVIKFGNATLWNGVHKNLSIYNRVLSNNELDTLTHSSFSIRKNGNLIVNELYEKPMNVPYDSVYFQLSTDTKDINHLVDALDNTGITYVNGYVWVNIGNKLHYNLNRDLGLDWNSNWTIIYWKYPIRTHAGNFTGYSIDSLGSNSNTVGGGYIWWGKANASDTISSSTPSSFIPADFFNNWHMVSLRKSGGTLTITHWGIGKQNYVRTQSMGTVAPNYYVTQYGYDLKLGGWDNINSGDLYFRDLIVIKSTLTDTQIESIYSTKIKPKGSTLFIQDRIIENGL